MSTTTPALLYTRPSRPLQIVSRTKRILGLKFLLALSVRIGMVTALLSVIGYSLVSNVRQFMEPSVFYGSGDLAFIIWLVLSTAFFVPFAAVIDLALCAVITYRIQELGLGWFSKWSSAQSSMVCLIYIDSFIEFISILFIGLLRLLGLALAIVETCHSEDRAFDASLRRTVFDLIFQPHYDWWSFKTLPKDFVSQKWYRRIYRPWLPPMTQNTSSRNPSQSTKGVTPYLSMFFGAKTFQTRRGERLWFVILRGAVSVACLAALVAFAANVLFLQPNDESAGPPIQLQRISTLPIGDKMSTPTWGVVIGIDTRYAGLTPDFSLESAVSVTEELQIANQASIPCPSTTFTSTESALEYFLLVSYQCSTLRQVANQVYTPQIYVRADYGALNISASNFTPEGSFKIWPSFTGNTAHVLASTKAMSLIVGNNLIASAEGTIRSSFSTPIRATFGFDSDQEMHIIGQLAILGDDPLFESDGTGASTIASIRLFKEVRTTDWELYSDSRQHTVLSGLSALGGLSVFLNSAFIILFGGSLMLVLFDVKPLSVFGLLHSFSKTRLSDLFKEDFPRLRTEGGEPGQSDAGLVAFMREYMLDFAPLDHESKVTDWEPGSPSTAGSAASGIQPGPDSLSKEGENLPASAAGPRFTLPTLSWRPTLTVPGGPLLPRIIPPISGLVTGVRSLSQRGLAAVRAIHITR